MKIKQKKINCCDGTAENRNSCCGSEKVRTADEIKKAVRSNYARVAKNGSSCCTTTKSSCCGTANATQDISKKMGYTAEDLNAIPEGANLGLGCGNPVAIASLKEGETVLDLGSGAGIDCFIAANKVGKNGKVIGVDMTPEMIEKARENARKSDHKNVEFRLGEIENLPVADSSVDVVISNCVINLAPDKGKVFKEAFRALRPGGRLMVSDIVLLKELPDAIKNSIEAYVGCISGAEMKDKYLGSIKTAGFQDVEIVDESAISFDMVANDPTATALIDSSGISMEKAKETITSVASVKVYGVKPSV